MQYKPDLLKWFDEYHEDLFKFLCRMTGDAHTSEDLLQETYAKAFLKFNLFDPSRGNLKNWLYRMALNLFYDSERFRKKEREAAREFYREISSSGRDASRSEHERTLLDSAMRRLPSEKRAMLLLSVKHRIDDIAAILSIPSGTVKSRIFNARSELTKIVEKLEREELS